MASRNTYAKQYLKDLEWETRARYKAAQQLPLIRLNALKVAWVEENLDEVARLVAKIDEEARDHWAREFAQYMGKDEKTMLVQFAKAVVYHNARNGNGDGDGDGDDEPTPPTPPAAAVVVRVPSTRNPAVVYTATTESCNCPGFHYRGTCRHVEMAAKKAAA